MWCVIYIYIYIYIYIGKLTYFRRRRRHQFSSRQIPIEILTNLKSYNIISTLTLPYKLMTNRDSKYIYLWNPIVLWTHCSKPLHQLCSCLLTAYSAFVIYCWKCSFIGLVPYWSHFQCIFLGFLSFPLYNNSHTHYSLFLQLHVLRLNFW